LLPVAHIHFSDTDPCLAVGAVAYVQKIIIGTGGGTIIVVDAPSVSLAIAVAVVVVCKNVPELTLSAKANGMSWRMNDVLDASGTALFGSGGGNWS